jgi:hypothetical protein
MTDTNDNTTTDTTTNGSKVVPFVATKASEADPVSIPDDLFYGTTVGLSIEAIKTVSILASAIMFAAPAFATQANPQNVIALADMFAKYASGDIAVSTPKDETSKATEPTFG